MKNFTINFLITLKNAARNSKEFISIKNSRRVLQILSCLYQEGFIQSYKIVNDRILIFLRYFFNMPTLKNLKIISTPSKPRYLKNKNVIKFSSKKAIIFLSTTKGIFSLYTCKKNNLGGKLLFLIN